MKMKERHVADVAGRWMTDARSDADSTTREASMKTAELSDLSNLRLDRHLRKVSGV